MSKVICPNCSHWDCWAEVSTDVVEKDFYDWDENAGGYVLKDENNEIYGETYFRCNYCFTEASEELKEMIIQAIRYVRAVK
jgi:hypothetical protein